MSKYRQPVRFTSTPKRRITFSVISTYGLEISSPCTSILERLPASGSAISSALRNCDETSPRTFGPFSREILRGVIPERRKSLGALVVDARPDAAQPVDQVADRPLVHARHAGEPVLAVAESERGGQRPERGARVAQEQICLAYRERSARSNDRLDSLKSNAKAGKRVAHHLGVVGVEQAADLGLALGQRGEQQDAVGDALRAGEPHRAGGAALGFEPKRFHQAPGLRPAQVFCSQFSRASRASSNSFSSAGASRAARSFFIAASFFV